jgi:hypothetical protein
VPAGEPPTPREGSRVLVWPGIRSLEPSVGPARVTRVTAYQPSDSRPPGPASGCPATEASWGGRYPSLWRDRLLPLTRSFRSGLWLTLSPGSWQLLSRHQAAPEGPASNFSMFRAFIISRGTDRTDEQQPARPTQPEELVRPWLLTTEGVGGIGRGA